MLDIKEAIESEKLMAYAQVNKLKPKFTVYNLSSYSEVYSTSQLYRWLNSDWTMHVCEMADIDYGFFKKTIYEYAKEQQ